MTQGSRARAMTHEKDRFRKEPSIITQPQRTLLEKITGESSAVALDWLLIYVAMLTLPTEGFLGRWPYWLGWTTGIGGGLFAILTVVAVLRWRKPFPPEHKNARKTSLLACAMGTSANVLYIIMAFGLPHIPL